MSPIVVHVVRPFATEAEYLAAEAWTIQPRGMLLISAPTLMAGTSVLFDIALADGRKLIRAEGRVATASGAHGLDGLRVRFKRFGAATKAFIEKAIALHVPGGPDLGPELAAAPASQPLRAQPSLLPSSASRAPSVPPASAKARASSRPAPPGKARNPSGSPSAPSPKNRAASTRPGPAEARKGLADEPRTRKASFVRAPQNRDELLARLRGRSRRVS